MPEAFECADKPRQLLAAFSSLLGLLTKGLAFLWTVDTAEADTLGVSVVQHFEGVAVED